MEKVHALKLSKTGDRILSVNGKKVANIKITNEEVVKLLGEKILVKIEVKRNEIKENIAFQQLEISFR